MRNFWIEGKIDGRKAKLTGGPRNKEGGFSVTVYVKSEGESMQALTVEGFVKRDGETLCILVADGDGNTIHTVEARR
jgi:hypothetical protein